MQILKQKLNIEYILKNLHQEDVMEFYTKIPVDDSSLSGASFTSPFRKDDKPTCNYYYTDAGKLRLRDWSGNKKSRFYDADIFDVAGIVYKLNTRVSNEFALLLHLIAKDFKIHIYADKQHYNKLKHDLDDIYVKNQTKKRQIKNYKVIPRKFNSADKRYWSKYNITEDLLKEGYVYCVNTIYEEINGELKIKYKYNSKNPCYGYYGGKLNGVNKWKFYFPFARKPQPKVIQNISFVQGKHLILPAEVGIITKSYKDVLCLRSFGIQSTTTVSESTIPEPNEIYDFKRNYNLTLSLMDFDKTGIRLAQRLKREYFIEPMMFTNGKYNTIDYGVKDFSDFVNKYGIQKTKDLVNRVEDYYSEILYELNKMDYEWLKNL